MFIRNIFIVWIFFSCSKAPPPRPIIMPPTKTMRPDLIEDSIFSRGYMSGYEIWEFLRAHPSENEVIETFGLPDIVFDLSTVNGSGKASELLGGEGVLLFSPGFPIATSGTI